MTDILGMIRKTGRPEAGRSISLPSAPACRSLPFVLVPEGHDALVFLAGKDLRCIRADALAVFAGGETLLALTAGQRDMLDKWLRLSPAQQRALVLVMDSMLEGS